MPTSQFVFAVHAEGPDILGVVEVLFRSETEARRFAAVRSRDAHVRSAAVTRYALDEPGNRRPVIWYRDGDEQERDWNRTLYPVQ